MAILGIEYDKILPPSASLFFELHEDDITQKLFTKIFLDNDELEIVLADKLKPQEKDQIALPKYSVERALENESLDEADIDSSFYNYLKRYLLRRVLSEEVSEY
jgi:hypothetical protein